jgi:hypothetical protein
VRYRRTANELPNGKESLDDQNPFHRTGSVAVLYLRYCFCIINFNRLKQDLNNVRFEVITVATMNNAVFWDVTPYAFVRTDVSEERIASIIRVTRIGELGTLSATSNRVTANVVPSSPILLPLMIEGLSSKKCRFLQEPHGVTSQKTAFFIVTAVKTSNLTWHLPTGLCS